MTHNAKQLAVAATISASLQLRRLRPWPPRRVPTQPAADGMRHEVVSECFGKVCVRWRVPHTTHGA